MDSMSSGTAPVLTGHRWWRVRLPVTENHLLGVTIFIVVTTLVINRFLLPPEWAESQDGLRFVEDMAEFYPGLRVIKENWAGYTPQIGVLFGSMALGMPIHLLLGLASALSFPDDRYKKSIVESSWRGVLFLVFVFSFFSTFPHFIPDVGAQASGRYGLDQASDSFSVLVISWLLVCAAVFISGQFIGALGLKIIHESSPAKGRLK